MIELALKNIEKYYGGNKVLDGITFEVHQGDRIGVLGRNGSGKTTIFKIISGMENYEGGTLSIRKGATIGYLDQIPSYTEDYNVIDVLNEAFKELFTLKQEMQKLEIKMANATQKELDIIIKKYGKIQIEFESKNGYSIEEKLGKICTGLKIDEDFKERRFNSLSGGEKTTVILGKILLQNPDILLLDEPTNHLDIESVEWLEEFLREYSGTVMVISHDRYFLDSTVNKIIEIQRGTSDIYLGNYSYYVQEKERRLTEAYEEYKIQQKKINDMEEAIKRFKDWGARGDNGKMFKKAENMRKRIERMEKMEKPIIDNKGIDLEFSVDNRSGKDVIIIEGLEKSFDKTPLLENLDFQVKYGEKVGLIGKNGCGKTTLFNILLGRIQADQGSVKLGANVKIGYLEQNIKFDNNDASILEVFREAYPVSEGEARGILARFLFYSEDVFKKVNNISGGEKVRLKLCILMHQDINLLLLDEPTNHLDIQSREMLEEALLDFDGTIVFISHDRYFINKIAKRIAEIKDKKIISYPGNYDYYVRKREVAADKERIQTKDRLKTTKKKNIEKPKNKDNSIEKALEEIELKIKNIEAQLEEKDIELNKYANDYEELSRIYEEKGHLQKERDILLEKWINMSIYG